MDAYLDRLFSLRGRRAVVTGGSSGIGREMALALSRAGADVVVIARRQAALEQTVDEMREGGGTAGLLSGNLGDRAETHAIADELLARLGVVDILVNSAGVNLRPPMNELTEGDWDCTMRASLEAPFVLGQRLGPLMADRGWGRILNMASQQSIRAFGNSGAYGVSKAAVSALTRSQAEAWSARGVCVNAVAPGFVHTPLTEAVFRNVAGAEAMAHRTYVGRNGRVTDGGVKWSVRHRPGRGVR